MDFMTVMAERGFLKDSTFDLEEAPEDILAYIGFDLTAPSLHVGSLIQLMVLRWLKMTGHDGYALLGEATTKIGDPSGKDASRQMLRPSQIDENREGIERVIRQVVPDVDFISNSAWFTEWGPSFMGFLAQYGPHFTVNRMLTFDSVKTRLERQQPLTFLEFSYMLLQAVDFREANFRNGVNMQIGGSDQWGNILNGVEIIRRMDEKRVFAFTTPLLLDSSGAKMGKSQGRPIWLDAKLTPVFDFFQYWRNCHDDDVLRFIGLFTDLPFSDPMEYFDQGINEAKKMLAYQVTKIVHGEQAAEAALEQSEAIYERGDTSTLCAAITATGRALLVDILVELGTESKNAARRLITGNGVSVNGDKVSDVGFILDTDSIIKVGKKPPVKVAFEKS